MVWIRPDRLQDGKRIYKYVTGQEILVDWAKAKDKRLLTGGTRHEARGDG